MTFIGIGLLILIIAIIVVATTTSILPGRGGLYVVYIGLFLAAFAVMGRGAYYITMKVSHVDAHV